MPKQAPSHHARILSAQQFAALDHHNNPVILIDLSSNPVYSRHHIPGAIWMDFKALVYSRPPVMGLLPDLNKLANTLGHYGITPAHHVIAYDDESGLKACRLLWTLDAIGHPSSALLDGGLQGWELSGLQRHNIPPASAARPSTPAYPVTLNEEVIADRTYIEAHLADPMTTLLDARSNAEYRGNDQRAAHSGHIPGAINIEWSRCLDTDHHTNPCIYLRPQEQLQQLFQSQGITPEQEIISYCHTHRRSAFHYVILKQLGFKRVRGYPGSWSEWGNRHDTPIE